MGKKQAGIENGSSSARQIVTSSSNNARLEKAFEHLESLLGTSEVLLVAPTRGAADDFVRTCCARRQALYGVHRTTLTGLAANLATERLAEQRLAPVTRLGTEALAARSIHACRDQLSYFGPVADTPGFPRALASTLSELRMEGVAGEALAATGAPGRDLSILHERYEKELAARSLADYALMCKLAAELAGASTRGADQQSKHPAGHRLLGLPVMFLDVSADSRAERTFLKAVAGRAPSVFATVLRRDDEAIAALEEILSVKAQEIPEDSDGNSLDRLRRSVFLPSPAEWKQLDDSVEFFSAPGEGMECAEIARRIRSAAEAGVAFDQMAIVLRHPDTYQPLVEDALRRAGVEAYCTRGAVRPDPSGRAFLALLDCAEQGLSASKFAEYLSLGQVPPVTESGAPPEPKPEDLWMPPEDEVQFTFKFPAPARSAEPVAAGDGQNAGPVVPEADGASGGEPEADTENERSPVVAGTLRTPFAWEKLLVDAAVIGGRERWSRRLRGLENEFRLRLTEAEAEEGNESHQAYLLRQIEHLKNLENFALPVIELLAALPEQARWGEWLPALRRLAGMVLRQPESVLSMLSELEPMQDVGPVTVTEVIQVLTDRLKFLRREPPTRRYGRVFVGAIEEVGARSFEIVFLPGLAEGVFPRRPSEDPLLLDEYRAGLSSTLKTREKRARSEELLLRSGAAASRSRLAVSYPRMDVAQSRPRVPSVFALEVRRAAEGRLPPLSDLEKQAANASEPRLGWPAPKEASAALDDAEYDLAVLEPLLRLPPEEVKGRGAYLVEASPMLARSLRTRWARWNWKWSGADGIYNPDVETLAVLAKHAMKARSYSPSALENYAKCPYRFLLQAIHRLREREEAVAIERLDPLTRGGLFHEVQFRFFRALSARKLLPVNAGNLSRVMDVADEVFNQVVAESEEKLAPAIPQVWKNEIEDLRTDLRGWVHQLGTIHAEWLPIHFEYAFGLPPGPASERERDPESWAEAVPILDGMKLRGSIDLVEQNVSGSVLRVTDHKTGRAPSPEPRGVGKGEILQPLLYALATEKMLGKPVKSGVLYYCTQRGNYRLVQISVDEQARQKIGKVISTIDNAIQAGILPAAPRHEACDYCDYSMVCGPHEERRIKEKQARLDALEDLRCLD